MIIDYSGIDASDDRNINRDDGLRPRVVEPIFTRAGAYDVKALGGRIAGTLGCSGRAITKRRPDVGTETALNYKSHLESLR